MEQHEDTLNNDPIHGTRGGSSSDPRVYIGKQELELVFDTIPEEICVLDREFRIVRANKAFALAVGLPVQSIIGKICFQLFSSSTACCADCPARQTFSEKQQVLKRQISFRHDDGIRHYEISTYPVGSGDGEVCHTIEIRRDITDEKRMLEYMVRSEKLASIGNMTAGIAHEMNNPLSGISGNATNLLRMPQKYGLNEKGVSRITAILSLATRATAIMTDLLHLSRRPEQVCVPIDVNELLESTVTSMHVWGGQDIERVFELADTHPQVLCDPSKVQQVIVHLTSNAVQALREKRIVESVAQRGCIVFSTKVEGGLVKIGVTDNGCGISPENQSRIFDPFFSTRPTGEGTGLGLSVSNKLVEEQGGRLFFESEVGCTIFTIELPVEPEGYC